MENNEIKTDLDNIETNEKETNLDQVSSDKPVEDNTEKVLETNDVEPGKIKLDKEYMEVNIKVVGDEIFYTNPVTGVTYKKVITDEDELIKIIRRSLDESDRTEKPILMPSEYVDGIAKLSNKYYNGDTLTSKKNEYSLYLNNLSAVNVLNNTVSGSDEFRTGIKGKTFTNILKNNNENYSSRNLTHHALYKDGEKPDPDTSLAIFKSTIANSEIVKIKLYHSGFDITINAPTITDMITLNQAILDEGLELGHMSNFLIYSNPSVLFYKNVMDLVSKLLNTTTLKYDPAKESIFDYISVLDINVILIGLVSSIYPRGFEIVSTCNNEVQNGNDTDLCGNVIKGKVSPLKLLFVALNEIPEAYKKQLLITTPRTITTDEANAYRNALEASISERYKLSNKIVLANSHTIDNEYEDEEVSETEYELKIPTISEYLLEGERWAILAQEFLNNALGAETEESKSYETRKQEALTLTSSYMRLSVYNAYIKTIKQKNGNSVIDTREGVLDALLTLAGTGDNKFESIIDKVKEIISYNTIALVGYPTYKCPKCEKLHNGTDSKYKLIVPIALDSVFFALSSFKIMKLSQMHA